MAFGTLIESHLFILFLNWWYCTTASDGFETKAISVCVDSGRHLTCPEHSVLHIIDARCMPKNYTCPEKEKISSLCNGQVSCATIGLKQQLHNYCKDSNPSRNVIVTFQCLPVTFAPPCRTNVCSNESQGLWCQEKSVIHLLKASCYHGDLDCSWKVYHTLYTMCEGQRSCSASGLRSLMPAETRDNHFIHQQNVFVDYICIEEYLLDDNCNGEFRSFPNRFGILTSPGFPKNTEGNPKGCYWAIYTQQQEEVEVTIHLSYSREYTSTCHGQFLQVQYMDCDTERRRTKTFCRSDNVNRILKSCGTVYIKHALFFAGEDRGSRFLVSYQVKYPGSSTAPYVPYMRPCKSGPMISTSPGTASTPVVPYTFADGHGVHGLLSGESGHKYGETSPSSSKTTENHFDPRQFTTIFKIVVINVFLFLVVVSLVIALIYVCVRYRSISKSGQYSLAAQGEQTGSPPTSSTQMVTFKDDNLDQRNHNDTSRTGSSVTHRATAVATIHTDTEPDSYYASVKRGFTREPNVYAENRTSVGNGGISSFRNSDESYGGVDPYASYSSLNGDYEVPPGRHKPLERTAPKDQRAHARSPIPVSVPIPPPPPPVLHKEETPTLSDDIEHYTINEDDYAIVKKPKRKYTNNHSNRASDPVGDYETAYDNTMGCSRPQRQNPPCHYVHGDVVPDHNCLLAHNLPPPPPPPRPHMPRPCNRNGSIPPRPEYIHDDDTPDWDGRECY